MRLAFLLMMKLLDSKFERSLRIIYKLLDDKIATFTIPHKEMVKQTSHMLTGNIILVLCLVALTGWGYDLSESSTPLQPQQQQQSSDQSPSSSVLRQLH